MFSAKDLKKLGNLDRDDLLELIGLETRKGAEAYVVPAMSAFAVGVLVGAGLGLLLAPKPGNELRSDLRTRLGAGEGNPLAGNTPSRVESTRIP